MEALVSLCVEDSTDIDVLENAAAALGNLARSHESNALRTSLMVFNRVLHENAMENASQKARIVAPIIAWDGIGERETAPAPSNERTTRRRVRRHFLDARIFARAPTCRKPSP